MFYNKYSSLLFLIVILLIYERLSECLTITSRLNNFRTPYTRRESFPAFASNPVYQLQRKIYRAYEEKHKAKIQDETNKEENIIKKVTLKTIYPPTVAYSDEVSDYKVDINNNISISTTPSYSQNNTTKLDNSSIKIDNINNISISTTPSYLSNNTEIDYLNYNEPEKNDIESVNSTSLYLQSNNKTDNKINLNDLTNNESITTTPPSFQNISNIVRENLDEIKIQDNFTVSLNEIDDAGIKKINDTNYRILLRARDSSEILPNLKRGLSVTDDYKPIDNKELSIGDETQVYFDGNLSHEENCTDEDKLLKEGAVFSISETKKIDEDFVDEENEYLIHQKSPLSEQKLDGTKDNSVNNVQSIDTHGTQTELKAPINTHDQHNDQPKSADDDYDYSDSHFNSESNSYRSNGGIFSTNNKYADESSYNSYTDTMQFYSRINDENKSPHKTNNKRQNKIKSHSSSYTQIVEPQKSYPVVSKFVGQPVQKSFEKEAPSLYSASKFGNQNFTRINHDPNYSEYLFDNAKQTNQNDYQFASKPELAREPVISNDDDDDDYLIRDQNRGKLNIIPNNRIREEASFGIIATLLDKFTMFQQTMKSTMQALVDRITAVEGSLAHRRAEDTLSLSAQYRESAPNSINIEDKQNLYNFDKEESYVNNEFPPIGNALKQTDNFQTFSNFPNVRHEPKAPQPNDDDSYKNKLTLPDQNFKEDVFKNYQTEGNQHQGNCVGLNCNFRQINPYVTILDEPPMHEAQNVRPFPNIQNQQVERLSNFRPISSIQKKITHDTHNVRPYTGPQAPVLDGIQKDNLIPNEKSPDLTNNSEHAQDANTKEKIKNPEEISVDYSSFPFNEPDTDNPECRDEDGIDCGQADDDDNEYLRRLDYLTKMDKFQARIFTDTYDGVFNRELSDIEHIEKKLEELKAKVALQEELDKILKHIKPTEPGCPYNVPSLRIGYRCFALELSHLTFDDAQRFCSKRGGTLAQEPLDVFLWAQITKAYPQYVTKAMWIGASDRDYEEGTFSFFNGDIISSSDPRWQQHSPSLSKFNKRDCLALDSKSVLVFKDLPCTTKLHFLCEFPLSSVIDIY